MFTSRDIGINTSKKVSFIFNSGLTAVMVQLEAFERTETNFVDSKQKKLSRNSVPNDSVGNTLCCNVWPVDV